MGPYVLRGRVQVDDAYLGGERLWVAAWSWIENKVPVSWQPSLSMRRATPVYKTCQLVAHVSFARYFADWAQDSLAIGCGSESPMGWLDPFAPLADSRLLSIILRGRKGRHPNELQEFRWIPGASAT